MKKFLVVFLISIGLSCLCSADDYLCKEFWENATVESISPILKDKKGLKEFYGEDKLTYLMMASFLNENPKIIQELITAGSDVNQKNEDGVSALVLAISESKNPEIIKELIKNGADLKQKYGPYNWNLLIFSGVTAKKAEIIEILSQNGFDLYKKFQSLSLLMLAAGNNPNVEVTDYLLKKGLDVNEKDKNGDTSLSLAAARNSNPLVIERLIKSGADINIISKDTLTPLLIAAKMNQNPDVIDVLVKNGADINYQGQHGETALPLALSFNKNPEVAKRILDNKFDLNKVMKADNETVIFIDACIKSTDPSLIDDMVQKYGANVHLKTSKGSTVLMVVSSFTQNPEIIKALIRNGLDVNETRPDGWTALMSAMMNPNPEIARTLIKLGADVNKKTKDGYTYLDILKRNNFHHLQKLK